MGEERRVVLVLVVDEAGRVVLVLHQPPSPEVADAFLVTGGPDDHEAVEIDRALYDVCRVRRFPVDHDRVPLEEDGVEQVVGILLSLDAKGIERVS